MMREISDEEIDAVDGGIVQVLMVAVAVYAAADALNDFRKGFRDGLSA